MTQRYDRRERGRKRRTRAAAVAGYDKRIVWPDPMGKDVSVARRALFPRLLAERR